MGKMNSKNKPSFFNAQKAKGFTLIELMIGVTIIGILASIAVPAYRDYTIRTRVSEAANLFYPVKAEMAVYYSDNRAWPASLSSMPRLTRNPASYRGDYVSTLSVSDGSVFIELRDVAKLGSAAQGEVQFIRSVSGITLNWRVSGGAGLADKYLPAER